MAALEICDVSHWFGTNRILNKINLRIEAGQIVALVGPSGCGKSTLLQAILGTHPPSEGQILADGQPVQGPSRNVGIVYQN
jgi:NitT/TauT family transport system ATP-binding protein